MASHPVLACQRPFDALAIPAVWAHVNNRRVRHPLPNAPASRLSRLYATSASEYPDHSCCCCQAAEGSTHCVTKAHRHLSHVTPPSPHGSHTPPRYSRSRLGTCPNRDERCGRWEHSGSIAWVTLAACMTLPELPMARLPGGVRPGSRKDGEAGEEVRHARMLGAPWRGCTGPRATSTEGRPALAEGGGAPPVHPLPDYKSHTRAVPGGVRSTQYRCLAHWPPPKASQARPHQPHGSSRPRPCVHPPTASANWPSSARWERPRPQETRFRARGTLQRGSMSVSMRATTLTRPKCTVRPSSSEATRHLMRPGRRSAAVATTSSGGTMGRDSNGLSAQPGTYSTTSPASSSPGATPVLDQAKGPETARCWVLRRRRRPTSSSCHVEGSGEPA